MKQMFATGLLLVQLTILSFVAHAREDGNYPVKTVNGTEYYVYTVRPGEGLYAIGRRFGVSQADINNANPHIHDGLKVGQEILVPKQTGTAPFADVQAATPAAPAADMAYRLHTVERRQTLFSISRKYNVTQQDIISANPLLQTRGVQAGDVLRIPLADPPKTAPAAPERTLHIGQEGNYITHRVAPGETLYAIGRKYNAGVNEIRRLNPGIDQNLPTGTTLKIPFAGGSAPSAASTDTQVVQSGQKSTYKIAYLLPFMAGEKNNRTADKFIEFYMGSLLAVNNIRYGDMKIEIHAFDTEKTEARLYEIINKPEMQDMDLIVGPAYTAQIPILADFAKRRQIYTIVPFSSKVAYIEDNPYLFQFNPDKEIQNDYVMNLLKDNFRNTHIIFVETGYNTWSDDGMDFFTDLKKRLDRQRTKYSVVKSSLMNGGWENLLTTGTKNVVVFDTDNYNVVQKHLAELHEAGSRFNVAVVGQYAWRGRKGKKPQMFYVSPFAGNKLGTEFYEQAFQRHYNKKLPTVNPRFDLLGYDITTYFLSTMKRDGFSFNSRSETLVYSNGVQSDFEFKRAGRFGGFVNHKLYVIEDEPTTK